MEGEVPRPSSVHQLHETNRCDGSFVDLEKVGMACQDNQVILCVDATQSVGAVSTDVRAFRPNFLAASCHKVRRKTRISFFSTLEFEVTYLNTIGLASVATWTVSVNRDLFNTIEL